jgi:hypothetical protein
VIQHPVVIRMGQADDSLWRIRLFTSTPARRLIFNVHQFMRSRPGVESTVKTPSSQSRLTHMTFRACDQRPARCGGGWMAGSRWRQPPKCRLWGVSGPLQRGPEFAASHRQWVPVLLLATGRMRASSWGLCSGANVNNLHVLPRLRSSQKHCGKGDSKE